MTSVGPLMIFKLLVSIILMLFLILMLFVTLFFYRHLFWSRTYPALVSWPLGLYGINSQFPPCFDPGYTQILRRSLGMCASNRLPCLSQVTWITFSISLPLWAIIPNQTYVFSCLKSAVVTVLYTRNSIYPKTCISLQLEPVGTSLTRNHRFHSFSRFQNFNQVVRYFSIKIWARYLCKSMYEFGNNQIDLTRLLR